MTCRGVWELPTPRLEQLLAALTRRCGDAVTAIGLQPDGFDRAEAEANRVENSVAWCGTRRGLAWLDLRPG